MSLAQQLGQQAGASYVKAASSRHNVVALYNASRKTLKKVPESSCKAAGEKSALKPAPAAGSLDIPSSLPSPGGRLAQIAVQALGGIGSNAALGAGIGGPIGALLAPKGHAMEGMGRGAVAGAGTSIGVGAGGAGGHLLGSALYALLKKRLGLRGGGSMPTPMAAGLRTPLPDINAIAASATGMFGGAAAGGYAGNQAAQSMLGKPSWQTQPRLGR